MSLAALALGERIELRNARRRVTSLRAEPLERAIFDAVSILADDLGWPDDLLDLGRVALIREGLRRTRTQKAAGELLGLSPRAMTYWKRNRRVREMFEELMS